MRKEIISFDLLTDNFTLEETDLNEKGVLNIADDLDKLLSDVQSEKTTEQNDNYKEFSSQQLDLNVRFNQMTDEQLDQLEKENEAKATHWQTNWVVKILRGLLKVFL